MTLSGSTSDVEPSAKGSLALKKNPALIHNAWAFAKFTYQKVNLPTKDEQRSAEKSATISFGEQLVEADLLRCQQHAQRADVFVTLGTSLGVYPVAALPEIAVRRGASLVVCNAEPTPFDTLASVRSDLPLGTLLPAVADRFGIPDPNSRI